MIGCDDEGDGAGRLEVEGIGEGVEGEATTVAIVKEEISVLTWQDTNVTTRERKETGKEGLYV